MDQCWTNVVIKDNHGGVNTTDAFSMQGCFNLFEGFDKENDALSLRPLNLSTENYGKHTKNASILQHFLGEGGGGIAPHPLRNRPFCPIFVTGRPLTES